MDCAIAYSKAQAEKNERLIYKLEKERLKSRADYLKETQNSFNAYIRKRDSELPCISCGRHHQGQYHAGHFYTVKSHPELRFEERNCHKQCSVCNNHLSGNILLYRQGLIARYGIGYVEWLESKHEPKHYSIAELKELTKLFKQKKKELDS